MNNITPTFVFLSVALLVWSATAGLSSYLGKGYEREHGSSAAIQSSGPVAPEIEELRAAVEKEPESIEAKMNLAYGLVRVAYGSSNGQLLMEAVQTFSSVLEKEPEYPPALLGLAKVCLDSGIIDKALDFFPRYLAKVPDDVAAQSDYALALIQAGEGEKARQEVQKAIALDQKNLAAQMTLAMIERAEGNEEEAVRVAKAAKALATDEAIGSRIDAFIANEASGAGAGTGIGAGERSPAKVITSYFENHEIISRKLQGVHWSSPEEVHVALKDFPVEQMPPFAKAKFESGVKTAFADLLPKLTVVLVEAGTDKELLRIPVSPQSPSGS